MAINFPTSLDALTNPTATDYLNSPSHAGQHADANDILEALEAKVGINSSAVTTSHDFLLAGLGAGISVKTYVDGNIGIKFAADAGSTDDYSITVSPAPTSYEVGDTYLFKANTANTGVATLNVNSLGATTIKKKGNTDLASNDILANNMVMVAYNSIEVVGVIDTYASSNINNNFGPSASGGTKKAGQSFACSANSLLKSIVLYGNSKVGSPTGDAYIAVYAITGTYGTDSVPTGSPLAISDTKSEATLLSGSNQANEFTFSGENRITLNSGTKYVFIYVPGSGTDDSNRTLWGTQEGGHTHGGNYSYTTDGTNWLASTGADVCFIVNGTTTSEKFEMLSQIAN